jgi:hypothetical protein
MEPNPPSSKRRRFSLFARIAHWRVHGRDGGAAVAAAVALLLALAPLLTIAGAYATARSIRGETAALAREAEPKLAAAREAEAGRTALRQLLATPTLGATLDGLARALPPESLVTSAERRADTTLTVEVATADPDRLRASLRRDPATAGLRDVGQRRGESTMLVMLEERAE